MKAYNIYNKGKKINSKPLGVDAINTIFGSKVVSVRVSDNTYRQYNVAELKIIECTVV